MGQNMSYIKTRSWTSMWGWNFSPLLLGPEGENPSPSNSKATVLLLKDFIAFRMALSSEHNFKCLFLSRKIVGKNWEIKQPKKPKESKIPFPTPSSLNQARQHVSGSPSIPLPLPQICLSCKELHPITTVAVTFWRAASLWAGKREAFSVRGTRVVPSQVLGISQRATSIWPFKKGEDKHPFQIIHVPEHVYYPATGIVVLYYYGWGMGWRCAYHYVIVWFWFFYTCAERSISFMV